MKYAKKQLRSFMFLLVLCCGATQGCRQQSDVPRSSFIQDWDSTYNLYQITFWPNERVIRYEGWYPKAYLVPILLPAKVGNTFSLIPLKDESYKEIEHYVWSTTSVNSKIVRVVNRMNNAFIDERRLDPSRDTIRFSSYFWIVQEQPDSLRYIFLRGHPRHRRTIQDTTLYCGHQAELFTAETEFWNTLDSTSIRQYKGLRYRSKYQIYFEAPRRDWSYYATDVSYWSRDQYFYLHFYSLWSNQSCTHPWEATTREERYMRMLIDQICVIQTWGGLQVDFNYVKLKE